jgi:hypothetical protein
MTLNQFPDFSPYSKFSIVIENGGSKNYSDILFENFT